MKRRSKTLTMLAGIGIGLALLSNACIHRSAQAASASPAPHAPPAGYPRATPPPPEIVNTPAKPVLHDLRGYQRFITDFKAVFTRHFDTEAAVKLEQVSAISSIAKTFGGSSSHTSSTAPTNQTLTTAGQQVLESSKRDFLRIHSVFINALPKRVPPPQPELHGRVYAGRGVWDDDAKVLATYANQTIYPKLTFPHSNSFLYAPTLLAANNACIEVTTVYSAAPAMVWGWDWCSSDPGPRNPLIATADFQSKYVRDLGDGVGQYTVQTSIQDNGQWTAALYDFKTQTWDHLWTSDGLANLSQSGGTGWDFFEEHAMVDDNNVSDYCSKLPRIMESTNVQVSYDRHTFTKLHSGASELVQNPLTCNRLKFDVPNQYWNWKITAGT